MFFKMFSQDSPTQQMQLFLQDKDNSWYEGINSIGEQGLFPGKYVEVRCKTGLPQFIINYTLM